MLKLRNVCFDLSKFSEEDKISFQKKLFHIDQGIGWSGSKDRNFFSGDIVYLIIDHDGRIWRSSALSTAVTSAFPGLSLMDPQLIINNYLAVFKSSSEECHCPQLFLRGHELGCKYYTKDEKMSLYNGLWGVVK